MDTDLKQTIAWILFAIVLIASMMLGLPKYNVWRAEVAVKKFEAQGKGALKRAEQEKQILIEQARAEVEAAKLRAQAIEAVGDAIQKYPEYRVQEFIGAFADAMESGKIEQIIYVPTEAGIPILEATRKLQ